MAETTVADLREDEHETVIATPRKLVLLEATWEIAALSAALMEVAPNGEYSGYLVVRGISSRMEVLCNAIMSAIDDDGVETEDLRRQVMRCTV